MSFKEEPTNIKLCVYLTVLTGLAFLLLNIPSREIITSRPFLFFVFLHIILDHLDVPLPRGQSYVSVGFATSLAMIMLFGPALAAWGSFSTIIHIRTIKFYKDKFHRALFNAAQLALATGIAGYVYVYSGGTVYGASGIPSIHFDVLPIIFCVTTYFLINSVIVMRVASLAHRMSFFGVWVTNFRWSVPNYFATSPLGILIVVVFLNLKIPGVLLLTIPLMVARHTFIMYMDMRNQYIDTIKALTKAIDAKDHYTHGHSERVAQYSVWIGQEMKLQEDFLEKLEYLALMHDIGKIGIPEHILNKPSRLSDEEFDLVRSHCAVGAEIITNIKYIGDHADIVRHHHERVDGRGYPDRLTGDKISLGSKIVCVADAFDAMTSARVYSNPMSKQEAVDELIRCADTQFCKSVVNAFVKVLQRRGEVK